MIEEIMLSLTLIFIEIKENELNNMMKYNVPYTY
jgi:hypothetical protein